MRQKKRQFLRQPQKISRLRNHSDSRTTLKTHCRRMLNNIFNFLNIAFAVRTGCFDMVLANPLLVKTQHNHRIFSQNSNIVSQNLPFVRPPSNGHKLRKRSVLLLIGTQNIAGMNHRARITADNQKCIKLGNVFKSKAFYRLKISTG